MAGEAERFVEEMEKPTPVEPQGAGFVAIVGMLVKSHSASCHCGKPPWVKVAGVEQFTAPAKLDALIEALKEARDSAWPEG